MHCRWCTADDAMQVMHRRWCTEGDVSQVMHCRWCTESDAMRSDSRSVRHPIRHLCVGFGVSNSFALLVVPPSISESRTDYWVLLLLNLIHFRSFWLWQQPFLDICRFACECRDFMGLAAFPARSTSPHQDVPTQHQGWCSMYLWGEREVDNYLRGRLLRKPLSSPDRGWPKRAGEKLDMYGNNLILVTNNWKILHTSFFLSLFSQPLMEGGPNEKTF